MSALGVQTPVAVFVLSVTGPGVISQRLSGGTCIM